MESLLCSSQGLFCHLHGQPASLTGLSAPFSPSSKPALLPGGPQLTHPFLALWASFEGCEMMVEIRNEWVSEMWIPGSEDVNE